MTMEIFNNLVCPIANGKLESYTHRVTVLLNAGLIALYLALGFPILMVTVAVDYGIRAMGYPKYSALRWVATLIRSRSGLPPKMVDHAPELFASRVGFALAAAGVLLIPINPSAGFVVAGILLVFALLDSVFGFCVACITYRRVVLPYYQGRGIRR